MGQHYSLYTKRVLLGYTTSFDVTLCLIYDKKQQFFALSPFTYGNFIMQSVEIQSEFERGAKKIYKIDEIHRLRLCEKDGVRFAVFEDISRNQRMSLSVEELKMFFFLQKTFSYAIQSLIFNRGKAIQFYRCYIKTCERYSIASVEDRHVMLYKRLPEEDETNLYPLDINLLFHQIPVMMHHELQRDISHQIVYTEA